MKILIIGKVWPEPASSAAGKRMKQLIGLFQERGEVHFSCANTFTGNELDLKELGVKARQIALNDDSVNVYFSELNPDVVVFDRFLTEEQYGWRIIEQCPESVRILNTEDLHFLRKTRHVFVKENNSFTTEMSALNFHNDETMRELASIYRSDLTLIISPVERQLLEEEMNVPSELLSYLPIFAEEKATVLPVFEEKQDFLFIGNVLHEPNLDAMRMLKTIVWPLIRQQLPSAKLILAGAYPTQQVLQMNNPASGIVVTGHTKELDELYASARVSLVPLRFGAGIKGKIMESLEYGVPFVSTGIGTEGMFFDETWDDCVANDWDSFVRKAVELYKTKEKWSNFQALGKHHLATYFDRQKHQQRFLTVVDELMETIHAKRKKRYYSQLIQHHSLMSTRYLSKWIMEKNRKE